MYAWWPLIRSTFGTAFFSRSSVEKEVAEMIAFSVTVE